METRCREIEVRGAPLEMGQQIGEATRDEIRGFAQIALERVNKTIAISRADALAIAHQSAAYFESYAPDMLEELRGISQSSGVALDDFFLTNWTRQQHT